MTNIFGKTNSIPSDKRKAAFAGTWYEADPVRLKSQLLTHLNNAEQELKLKPCDNSFPGNVPACDSTLAVIAPHAGYMFSARTAAFAYERAKGRKVKRVFLFGPSHYVSLHGLALPSEHCFSTPLGDLTVDSQLISELADFPLFAVQPEIHSSEHSLEMQLPFIRQVFGDVLIVPIIVGSLADQVEVQLIAQILKRFLRDDDLIVVSSDFTHYGPRYDYEPFSGDIAEQLRELDEQAFSSLEKMDLESFVEFRARTSDTICGFYPCCLLLSLLPPGTHATLLNYRTSRDTVVEEDRNSVSYMAIVFSKETQGGPLWSSIDLARQDQHELSDEEKKALLVLARDTLTGFVTAQPIAEQSALLSSAPIMKEGRGVFVTLYKRKHVINIGSERENKDLRGCIGYIWPIKPLVEAVSENVIGACSRDPRFEPVVAAELDDIIIDINVLSPLKRVDSYKDIVLGRDGIVFYKAGRQAVFLPSVPTDFNWDLSHTLSQLSIKAGCGPDGWKSDARFDVFQSQSFMEPT